MGLSAANRPRSLRFRPTGGAMTDSTLGSRVRARRQRLGLTLKDLASTTSLAEALGATVADLLGGHAGVADGPPLSVSLQRFVRSDDFARRVQRLAEIADRPMEDVRQEVINFLATAPKRASGDLTTEDWRRLLTYYASLLQDP